MSKVTASKSVVLRRKKTVFSRAHFWKIPHDSGAEDINLKIGRYKIMEDLEDALETGQPKSELTLDHEEFQALLKFLGENYEPFRQGVRAFIPLDRPFDIESAKQIRALFSLPDKKALVAFILKNEVIPEDLEAGLRQAQRAKAVKQFEEMLSKDLRESSWQTWFQANNWVLGSQFVRVLEERDIDTKNISDFLMEAYDGFLDVVEIKARRGVVLRLFSIPSRTAAERRRHGTIGAIDRECSLAASLKRSLQPAGSGGEQEIALSLVEAGVTPRRPLRSHRRARSGPCWPG